MPRKLVSIRSSSGLDTSPDLYAVPTGYEFSKQIGHLLRKAYQRHTAIFQRICPDEQLTSVQFAVLCAVEKSGPCSLTVIARAACIDPATTRGVVERLRERKWISLQSDPLDGRKVIVQLEESGRAFIEVMLPFATEITRLTMRDLNVGEHVALEYLLDKIARAEEDPGA